MLTPETAFPYVGSYAVYVDLDQPPPQRDELVRIQGRRTERTVGEGGRSTETGFAMVAFPLRDGASGNKTIAAAELIDGTPLTHDEKRELADLERALFGRSLTTPKQKRLAARRDALRSRAIWEPHLTRLLREHRARQASQREAA